MTFWLTDSRSRSATGRRKVYQYPEEHASVVAIWKLVVSDECPAEWDDYKDLAEDVDRKDAYRWNAEVEIFNEYWTCYGWCMEWMEDDAELPQDCDLMNIATGTVDLL